MIYFLLFGIVWLAAWLPLRVLYLLSDVAYFIVFHLVKYRRKIVFQNLKNSFPQKSEKELHKIERRFYHFFCDMFVESIKKMHMSEKQIRRRFEYANQDAVLQQLNAGKSIILMTAHFGNWEWFSSFTTHISEKFRVAQIYKALHSKGFNRFMLLLRSKFHTVNIERKTLLRQMLKMHSDGIPTVYGFLSDQSPRSSDAEKVGVYFLNQKTPIIFGAEKIAQKLDYPVFYGRITCKKRGYYHCEFIPITLKPNELGEFEITKQFMHLLENDICRQPELWLWTHKRWKFASRNFKII
ncbi:MAG: lysophospholipid acyltransferase family protein [Paludibacter sp.]|nr:lysophospholipid acyltransferase family protein [Paludibacter sp.]